MIRGVFTSLSVLFAVAAIGCQSSPRPLDTATAHWLERARSQSRPATRPADVVVRIRQADRSTVPGLRPGIRFAVACGKLRLEGLSEFKVEIEAEGMGRVSSYEAPYLGIPAESGPREVESFLDDMMFLNAAMEDFPRAVVEQLRTPGTGDGHDRLVEAARVLAGGVVVTFEGRLRSNTITADVSVGPATGSKLADAVRGHECKE